MLHSTTGQLQPDSIPSTTLSLLLRCTTAIALEFDFSKGIDFSHNFLILFVAIIYLLLFIFRIYEYARRTHLQYLVALHA